MYPISVTVTGTAVSTAFYPDIYQNPFQIGVGCVLGTGSVATYQVEHTFDYAKVISATWNGTTATWYANSGITSTSVATCNGNYAFPVAAIRLNVLQAGNATSTVTMNLIQASNAP